jgi:hypothetical protein
MKRAIVDPNSLAQAAEEVARESAEATLANRGEEGSCA